MYAVCGDWVCRRRTFVFNENFVEARAGRSAGRWAGDSAYVAGLATKGGLDVGVPTPVGWPTDVDLEVRR